MKTPPGIFEYCERKFASSDLHLLPSLWRRRSLKSDEPRLSSASGLLAKPGSVETILKHDTRTHALESRAIRPKMSHGRHRGLTERARTGVFLIAPRRSENSPAAANAKKQTLKRRQAIPPANKTGGRKSVNVGVKETFVVKASLRCLAKALQTSHSPEAMLPFGRGRV